MAFVFLAIVYVSFVTLGLPDSAIGAVWPYMRVGIGAQLSYLAGYAVLSAGLSALSSLLAPLVMKRIGTGKLAAICSFLTGAGMLGMAFIETFWQMMICGTLLGVGAGAVDVAVNHFVSERYPSSVMNRLHACWGLGAMIGPLIATAGITLFGSWRAGIIGVASLQLLFSIILFATLPLWNKNYARVRISEETVYRTADPKVKTLAIVLSMFIFLLYTGAESGVGQWTNSLLIESRGFTAAQGGLCDSLFFGGIMSSRLLFGLFSDKLGSRASIRLGLIIAAVGSVFFIIGGLAPSFIGVTLIGLGFGPVYPMMMHGTAARFEQKTATKVVGFQSAAACCGIFSITPMIGLIAEKISLEIFPIIILCAIALLAASVFVLDFITKADSKAKEAKA